MFLESTDSAREKAGGGRDTLMEKGHGEIFVVFWISTEEILCFYFVTLEAKEHVKESAEGVKESVKGKMEEAKDAVEEMGSRAVDKSRDNAK